MPDGTARRMHYGMVYSTSNQSFTSNNVMHSIYNTTDTVNATSFTTNYNYSVLTCLFGSGCYATNTQPEKTKATPIY